MKTVYKVFGVLSFICYGIILIVIFTASIPFIYKVVYLIAVIVGCLASCIYFSVSDFS